MSVIFVDNGVSEEVNSPLGVSNLRLFAKEKNVAAQPHPPTNQEQTCIFQISLGEALNDTCLQKSPRGGGEGFTFWPTDYTLLLSMKVTPRSVHMLS